MGRLLFLAHRVPYPPNKGDKISTYNMLRYFSERHDVFFGAFVDSEGDWQHVNRVRALCRGAHFAKLNPRSKRLVSLRGLLTGEPLTLPYYRDADLKRWVDDVLRIDPPDAILIYSAALAQFVTGKVPEGTRVMFDIEDVDSEKWRDYATRNKWPMSWIYAREARRLLAYEKRWAAEFDVTVLVSREEAALFRRLAPEAADKVVHRTQGVDSRFFDPTLDFDNPYGANERVLVFVGAMDYWPNVDAVTWFAKEVFSEVRARVPQAAFYIVGLNPSAAVRRLGQLPGITVTGEVPDVRPYVRHAAAACLPLRIARGIQNKALEAMAMERPLLASPAAMDGIEIVSGFEPIVAESADDFAAAAAKLLSDPPGSQPTARHCVLQRYDWDTNLSRLEKILFEGATH